MEKNYEFAIGKKVAKKSVTKKKHVLKGKPFKSGLLINTVKGVVEHKQLGIPAYVFEEDDSYVECRRCRVLESYEVNKYTKHQEEILRFSKENPNKIIIIAEQGLGKTNEKS